MLRMLYRLPLLWLALFAFLLVQTTPCQAKMVSVELIWKLGQAGWVQIEVENGDYQLVLDKTKVKFSSGSILQVGWGGWAPVVRVDNENFQSFSGSSLKLYELKPGSLRVKTPEGKDVVYRGALQLNWQEGHWRIINQVDSEDYLKGVVPIEMSNEWAKSGNEALKAQTVAARTYLMKHSENGQKIITDSPDVDQAYAGMAVEGAASEAVEATRGEILVDAHTGQPIDALYSSHSGGYTEDANNVWGNADTHNVSHPDPYSNGIGGPVDHWRFIVSGPILGSTFGLGPVLKVELDKFPSGRVKSVRMEDGFGHAQTVKGRAFVKAFYPFGQPIKNEAFLGSLFEAEVIPPKLNTFGDSGLSVFLDSFRTADVTKGYQETQGQGPLLAKILSTSLGTSLSTQPYGVYIFKGRGWGHGVGMSQWGAYHMAQIGFNYQDIIAFYYYNTLISEEW